MYSITVQEHDIKDMRYDTVGDWFPTEDGCLQVHVAKTGSADMNFLLTIHEMIESFLCIRRGIHEAEVTLWDMQYDGDGEPGADPQSPYYWEHSFAEVIERLLATELGIDWGEYTQIISKVYAQLETNKHETLDGLEVK